MEKKTIKQTIFDNLTIERCAGILYYSTQGADEHPEYAKYGKNNHQKFIEDCFPEILLIEPSDILRFMIDKLIEIEHPKANLFRDIAEITSFYHIKNLEGLTETWITSSFKHLSMNRYHVLEPFPINSWYSLKTKYMDNHKSYRNIRHIYKDYEVYH